MAFSRDYVTCLVYSYILEFLCLVLSIVIHGPAIGAKDADDAASPVIKVTPTVPGVGGGLAVPAIPAHTAAKEATHVDGRTPARVPARPPSLLASVSVRLAVTCTTDVVVAAVTPRPGGTALAPTPTVAEVGGVDEGGRAHTVTFYDLTVQATTRVMA